jgi:hypothetical protein
VYKREKHFLAHTVTGNENSIRERERERERERGGGGGGGIYSFF